jgi:hypothetical protein
MDERKLYSDERPRKLYHATFRGSGVFAYDMLRYDSCWPTNQEDVSRAFKDRGDSGYNEVRTVQLTSYSPFTPARWLSFGWREVSREQIDREAMQRVRARAREG